MVTLETKPETLGEGDVPTLLKWISSVGKARDASAIPRLSLLLLEHDDRYVRARAASALGQIGSERATDALSKALASGELDVRRRAVQALNQLRDPASSTALVSALGDDDRDVRRWAARGLGMLGDPSVLQPLADLRNDRDVVVQDEVARAVQAIQDRQALQVERTRVEGLREQRSHTDTSDFHAQSRLDLQIDLEQLGIDRLEARLAGRHATIDAAASADEVTESDRGRPRVIYRLEGLLRELESLSASARYVRMREAWEARRRDARLLLSAWQEARTELTVEAMEDELRKQREGMEERFVDQKRELIDLARFMNEGDDTRLETTQVQDQLTDPRNQARVSNWVHAAEAEYEWLRSAREQGDYERAKEHYEKLVQLRQRTQALRKEEEKARAHSGVAVIVFMLFAVLALTGVLYWLFISHNDGGAIPSLGVPFSVVVWSAVGAIAAMLYQFLNRPVSQLELVKWLVARPVQGIIMGSFLYLVVAAGILVLGNKSTGSSLADLVRPELAGVIAFLGGFSDRFADEMVRRATNILTPE